MYHKNNTKVVRVQECAPRKIQPWERVKCIKQGNRFAEVVSMKNKPKPGVIRLSRDEYKVISTGEVKQYNYSDVKQAGNLSKTFNELRYLIRTNFTENGTNQLFVTLTYAHNMTDPDILYMDFRDFMKRLRYRFKEHNFEYIVVAEPQGRGAWHMHLMLKTDKDSLYIDHALMSQIWGDENIVRQTLIANGAGKKEAYTMSLGEAEAELKARKLKLPAKYRPILGHGWATTERLKSDDVGTYYVAYFTDLETEANADKGKRTKKSKKGSRLSFYPKGFRFYRCSRGIKRPEVGEEYYFEVREGYGKPEFAKAYEVQQLETEVESAAMNVVNVIQRETYKRDATPETRPVLPGTPETEPEPEPEQLRLSWI